MNYRKHVKPYICAAEIKFQNTKLASEIALQKSNSQIENGFPGIMLRKSHSRIQNISINIFLSFHICDVVQVGKWLV